MHILVRKRRVQLNRKPWATTAVIDSQSVKWGTIDSIKGIDGFKRVKGIKRHVAVDCHGYPLEVIITTANVHDSKAAYKLIPNILVYHPRVQLIKADKGYCGRLEDILPSCAGTQLECVKSNFGTSEFIPLQGRWVVERAFSWLESYRRMNRNYEKRLDVARHMTICACIALMLKFF